MIGSGWLSECLRLDALQPLGAHLLETVTRASGFQRFAAQTDGNGGRCSTYDTHYTTPHHKLRHIPLHPSLHYTTLHSPPPPPPPEIYYPVHFATLLPKTLNENSPHRTHYTTLHYTIIYSYTKLYAVGFP